MSSATFPHLPRTAAIFALALVLAGCKPTATTTPPSPPATNTAPAPIYYGYDIVNTFPHDVGAFTEGLVFADNRLFESTGLNGHSMVREVDLKTGAVIRQITVPSEYFGEGLAILGSTAYELTWQDHKGFIYDRDTFKSLGDFSYTGEGWGLTTDGESLIMSDGTSQIRFLNPANFEVQRTINVTLRGTPVTNLNELEYIKGEIFANIWQTYDVVRIDPKTGVVTSVIDFSNLLPPEERTGTDVLNGIAYDAANDRLFITGKFWPKLYEVRLHPLTGIPGAN